MKAKLIILLIRCFSVFSLKSLQRIGAFMGALAWRFNAGPARVTRKNLEVCFPHLDAAAREELGRISLQETGKTGMEMAMAWGWPTEKALATVRQVEGEALVHEALERGQGLILLGPHLGNWELVGLYLSSRLKMAALYDPPSLPELERFMTEVRSRVGSELVPTTKRGVLRLFQILRENGVVGILPDQEPDFGSGEFVPFFGVPANTIRLVSKLIEKTGAAVLCVFAERLPDAAGFTIKFRAPDSRIYDADLVQSVSALSRSVENCVREIPAQYQWEYKRFKRRPDRAAHFYD